MTHEGDQVRLEVTALLEMQLRLFALLLGSRGDDVVRLIMGGCGHAPMLATWCRGAIVGYRQAAAA